MKNVYEVLRKKEQELVTLQQHVDALRIAAPLLHDDEVPTASPAPVATVTVPEALKTVQQIAAVVAPAQKPAAGWDAAATRWP